MPKGDVEGGSVRKQDTAIFIDWKDISAVASDAAAGDLQDWPDDYPQAGLPAGGDDQPETFVTRACKLARPIVAQAVARPADAELPGLAQARTHLVLS